MNICSHCQDSAVAILDNDYLCLTHYRKIYLTPINKKKPSRRVKKTKEEALLKIKYTTLMDRCLCFENFSIILISFIEDLKRINNLK